MFEDLFSSPEKERYQRHFQLPEVGTAGQAKLKSARTLIIGAGGLGSPVSLYLAAAGVGTLGLMDFDRISLSNLQRQILYAQNDCGQPKVDIAAQKLRALNPHITIHTHKLPLDTDSAIFIQDYDLVIDACDNVRTRYLLNDACVKFQTPWIYGSLYRFEGQFSFFNPSEENGPCYRCLYPEMPPPEAVPTCNDGGVLGVLPGLVGTQQALQALKYILDLGHVPLGEVHHIDALDNRTTVLKLPRNPQCLTCSLAPETLNLERPEYLSVSRRHNRPPEALHPWLNAPEVLWIDVRSAKERAAQHLPSIHIPLDMLKEQLPHLPQDKKLVVYCHSGRRGQDALSDLLQSGFKSVYNLQGGIEAWKKFFPLKE